MSVLNVEDCLLSFTNWPVSAPVSAIDLAIAGFMYTGEGDRVICIYCRGQLHTWLPGDVPINEHNIYFPHCPSIAEDYIPFDIAPVPIEEPLAVLDDEAEPHAPFDDVEELPPVYAQLDDVVPIEVPEWMLCRVCITIERDIVLMPCFHLVLCGSCLPRLSTCPVCRQPITGSMKVFLA